MQKLIKVTRNEKQEQVVSARELHEVLELKGQFTNWADRVLKRWEENVDFISFNVDVNPTNGVPIKNYLFTVEMAKHICMMCETEKGDEVRKYFIECEKKSIEKQKPLSFEEMVKQTLQLAQERIEALEEKIEQDKPLVAFANAVASSSDSILIREACKVLELPLGQNKLYEFLRTKGMICKNSTEPTQEAINRGYFEVVERTIMTPKGSKITLTTKLMPKGQLWLANQFERGE